jgi:hypothetical protein
MSNKNHSIRVDISKGLNFLKDSKWIVILIIMLLMVFRVECSNSTGKLKFSVGCVPLRPSEVKEVLRP